MQGTYNHNMENICKYLWSNKKTWAGVVLWHKQQIVCPNYTGKGTFYYFGIRTMVYFKILRYSMQYIYAIIHQMHKKDIKNTIGSTTNPCSQKPFKAVKGK